MRNCIRGWQLREASLWGLFLTRLPEVRRVALQLNYTTSWAEPWAEKRK